MIEASLAFGTKVKYEGLATIEFLVNIEKEIFDLLNAIPGYRLNILSQNQ